MQAVMEPDLRPLSDDRAGRSAAAFNAGCDARIAGLPKNVNPYQALCNSDGGSNYAYWRMGWDHVDSYWAKESRYHPVKHLPVVFQ